MSKNALILGSSSGFGAATALRLAKDGYNIFGVHLDRKATMPEVEKLIAKIKDNGAEVHFYNINAADDEKRREVVDDIRTKLPEGELIKVVLHSLAFGTLKPFISKEKEKALTKANIIMTMDVMAHSLIYWVQDLFWAGLLGKGSRIYGMTSHGSDAVVPTYGAVSAAKAALENHIQQLALELGKYGVTANALKAGVTNTPALQKIPGHQEMMERAVNRNPSGRLTTPEDVANAISLLSQEDSQWISGGIINVDFGESVIDQIEKE
jgi:NAD(P)-dependent dehydrogenase (short-subunit alcohol dehydrogenase family)